jgi:hypothetical protein
VIRFGRSLLDQRHWRPPTRVASKSSAVPVSAVGAVPSSLASSAFESKDDSCAEFEGPAPRKAPLRFSVSRRSMLLSPWARSWVSSAGHLVSRVRKWTKQAGGGGSHLVQPFGLLLARLICHVLDDSPHRCCNGRHRRQVVGAKSGVRAVKDEREVSGFARTTGCQRARCVARLLCVARRT